MNDPFLPKTRIAPQFGGPGTGLVIPPETPETSFSNFRISDWWQTTASNAAATLLSRAFAADVDAPVPWRNDKEFAKFAADVPPSAWGDLYNAPNKYEAEFLRAEFIQVQQAKERIASSGFGGEMLASGLSFAEPMNIVALAVPLGGAANTMRFMTRAGRLSWLAGQSLLGGSVNVAAESLRAAYDPTFDRSALATAFASGAAAGITGPLGTNLSRGGRFALTGGGQFAAVGGVGIASGQSVGDAASAAAMAMIVGGSLAALPPTVRSQIEARLSEVPLVAAGDDARAAGLPLTPEGEQRTAFKPGKVEPEVVAVQAAPTPVPPPAEAPAPAPATPNRQVPLDSSTATEPATPTAPPPASAQPPSTLYHGTRFDGDLDPSKTGGILSMTTDRNMAVSYAHGEGGMRQSANDSMKYVVAFTGVAYERQGDQWLPVGIWDENTGTSLVENLTASQRRDLAEAETLLHAEVERDIRNQSGLFSVVYRNATVRQADLTGRNFLDLRSPEGVNVLAGLSAGDNRQAANILADAKTGEFFWSRTKFAKADKAWETLAPQLEAMGYNGIVYRDDGGPTWAAFPSAFRESGGVLRVQQPAAEASPAQAQTSQARKAMSKEEMLATPPERLEQLAEELDARDVAIVKKYIPDFDRASARNLRSKEIATLEDNASPEDYDILFRGSQGNAEEAARLAQAGYDADLANTPAELASNLSRYMLDLKDHARDGGTPTGRRLDGLYTLNVTRMIADAKGWNADAVIGQAVQLAADRLGKDGTEVLSVFFKRADESRPTTPARPALPPALDPTQPTLFDAYSDSPPPPPPSSDGPAVAVGATTPGQTTSTVDRAVEPGDFVATEMRYAKPDRPLKASRWDFAYQVGSSLIEDVRELGTMLFSDSLVRADGTVNMSSAADSWVRQNVQKREIAHARAMDEAFDGWAKDQMAAGRSRVDLMMRGRREFNQEVAKAARRQPGQYTQNPAINKAADAVRRELGELLNLQQRHLVDGMDKVGPNDNYVHRVYNLTRTMEAINRHGMDNVVRLFRDAMERHMTANRLQPGAFPPIDPKILDAAAAGMVERMVAGKLGFESVGGVVQMPSDMSGVLAQILRSKGVPEDTITATLARMVDQESEAGRIDSARSRVALDETTEIVTPAGRLSIEDILENDVDVLMTVYRRKALGASAMSEIFRSFRAKGYDEVFTFDGLLGRIRSEAQKKALQPGADMLAISRDLEANIDRLTVGYRHVMGEVLFPPSTKLRGRVDDVLALARQASYGIVMNVNGFAQIADTFKFLAPENLKALRKQIPAMGNIIDMARSGKMPSELIRELEYHTGVGADAIAERMINRFDDNAASNQLAGGRIESAMRAIGRVTSWIGFSRPINLFNQRTAALTAMQRIGDAIFDGNTPDEIFARMGIGDRNMADRIVNQIRTNGRARANNAIEHLGLDKWDDYEAYAAWQSAFDRMRREINQENDFGNNTLWMTTEVGRSVMQFRTFANVAYQKATLRGAQRFLNGEGWEQAGTMLVNSIGGLLGYVALTYVNSLGREDRDEFLRERLSSNALATAMFARSQWSSLFPLAADTVGFHVWGQQPFTPARNSGLQGHILFGNPTLSLVAGASNAVRGAVAPSLSPEYSFSREDLQAIRSVTPFQNAVGLSYFWNTLREDLPARSLEPQR